MSSLQPNGDAPQSRPAKALAAVGRFWALWAARFRDAWQVILHFHAVQAKGLRSDVGALIQPATGQRVAVVDSISIDGGQIQVVGRLEQPYLRFVSERAQLELRGGSPDAPLTFDATIEGGLVLRWAGEGGAREQSIRLHSWLGQGGNIVRTLWRLAMFAPRNARDIAGYFFRGDSAAGMRLERRLLPLPKVLPKYRVDINLFGDSALPTERPGVDIVVPVHNALADVRVCLARLAATVGPGDRIWVIDDASSEPGTLAFLRPWVASMPQARLLENTHNLGFIGTVNAGLEHCLGHVVLLNTDAFVPDRWLERLLAPILDDASIASVTPMSNDAEIFSVPVICKARALEPGEGTAIDRALSRLDWRIASVDAPTGVGFCMALNRRWLELEPQLDRAFGKGYGEEVDWCRKTAAMGGRHVVQGALFVEHAGGRSFSGSKAALIQQGNMLITKRYPTFDRMVEVFQETDPAVGARLLGAVAWLAQKGPLSVYLAHDLGGGAQAWLTRRLQELTHIKSGAVVVRAIEASDTVWLEVHTDAGVTRAEIALGSLAGFLGVAADLQVTYSCLVGARDPLAVLDAVLQAMKATDSLDIVFHDFLVLCPSYNLLGADRAFCNLPEPEACQRCYERLTLQDWTLPNTIADWRAAWRKALDRAETLTAYSPSSKTLIAKTWPDLAGRIEVRSHRLLQEPAPIKAATNQPLTVGVLGNIGYSKGAAIVRDLCSHVSEDFRVVLIGKIEPAFADNRMIVHGSYDGSEISELAQRYGVTCWLVPSIWPETFCFALHECLATGLPVYAFDLGAQSDALKDAQNGRLLALNGPPLTPATFQST